MRGLFEKYIFSINEVLGIEVILNSEVQLHISYAHLCTKKSRIIFKERSYGIANFSELTKKISNKFPVALTITGNMVYCKLISKEESNSVLQTLIGNTSSELFYKSEVEFADGVLLTIARKDNIDKIITDVVASGFHVLSVNIGYCVFLPLVNHIDIQKEGKIDFSTAEILLDKNRRIVSFTQKLGNAQDFFQIPEYRIEDIYVSGGVLIAFAAAFEMLLHGAKTSSNINHDLINVRILNFKNERIFKSISVAGLVVILILLIVSFFLFNYYFRNQQILQEQIIYKQVQGSEQNYNQRQIELKERALSDIGWLKNSRMSFYADKIGSLKTMNIRLKSLKMFPFKPVTTSNQGVYIQKDTILIAGNCSQPVELNQYINNLKLVKGFGSINLRKFGNQQSDWQDEFIIEILLDEK